jgi:hypothetical protein
MLDDKSPCPSCGAHPMLTLRRQDGTLELRCGSCGVHLDVPPAPTGVDLAVRVGRFELMLRSINGDQLDFAKRLAQIESRVEKLEGGKVE